MSLQNHLVELERRRQALDKEIETGLLHPSISDIHISDLKRKKLLLRDEIEKLRLKTLEKLH